MFDLSVCYSLKYFVADYFKVARINLRTTLFFFAKTIDA